MTEIIHECLCAACLADKDREEWKIHHQMNVLLSRLDEQQCRWYVVLESKKIGHGGDVELSTITGMDVETIRRGRRELDDDLRSHSPERIREEGGGQPAVEKKTHRSRRH
ncbi:MAG: hypothetical protein WCK35_06465 [Chloroflexota bacterium]